MKVYQWSGFLATESDVFYAILEIPTVGRYSRTIMSLFSISIIVISVNLVLSLPFFEDVEKQIAASG